MCGRMDVSAEPIKAWAADTLGITLNVSTNHDLRPTQTLTALATDNSTMIGRDYQWGIKPSWAKNILINAQAETVATKKTFKDAFYHARCLVPCMGWYEWRDEGGPRKQKYRFSHQEGAPLLMAAIHFKHEPLPQVVTLTTQAEGPAADIHARMPLFIAPHLSKDWLENDDPEHLHDVMLQSETNELVFCPSD